LAPEGTEKELLEEITRLSGELAAFQEKNASG